MDPIRWKLIYLVRLWTCCACEGQRRTPERKQMYIPKDNGIRQIRGLCEERIKRNCVWRVVAVWYVTGKTECTMARV